MNNGRFEVAKTTMMGPNMVSFQAHAGLHSLRDGFVVWSHPFWPVGVLLRDGKMDVGWLPVGSFLTLKSLCQVM